MSAFNPEKIPGNSRPARSWWIPMVVVGLGLPVNAEQPTDRAPSAPGEVVREVVTRNQELRALEARIEASEHAVPQAGSMPDPIFLVGLSNWPLSSGETPLTGVQFELKQTFPWFGKLGAREAVAEKDLSMRRAFLSEMETALQARAWSLLWEVRYQIEHRKLAEEIGLVLDQFGEVTEATYTVGKGRQQDLIKPGVEKLRIEDVIVSIDGKRKVLESAINALRNRRPEAPIVAPDLPAEIGEVHLDRERLLAHARRHNPHLLVRSEAVAKQHEELRLAEKGYYPDITLGLQYRIRWVERMDAVGGADFIGVTLGLNLPIWAGSKQSERVEEVSARIRAEESLDRSAWDRIRDGIEQAAQRMEQNRAQALLFRDGIIPDTEKALESSLADYQAGRIEFLSVLDNVMKLFKARVDLLRRTVDIQMARTDLEQVLGDSLENALGSTGDQGGGP